MSVYIDLAGNLVNEQARNLVLSCPHCETTSHITVSAVPRFEDLQEYKPAFVGVVYRCDACNSPVFLRYAVRSYRPDRIELAPQFTEVERPREKFSFTHLPEEVEQLFREALACFSNGAYNAFSSMCRRTAQAAFTDLGESGKLRLFDELNAVRDMADLDGRTFITIKNVIFGTQSDQRADPPFLDAMSAAVVLEVMKDLLYEAYVRKGRLQQALTVRRYFAEETADNIASVLASPAALKQAAESDTASSP
ncbi:MAG TPA: hypothetical protein VMU67_11730 [Steroidobacteraceae bacterium]|nr:hypothetical protein [Steroidobacteraceae bacterium]